MTKVISIEKKLKLSGGRKQEILRKRKGLPTEAYVEEDEDDLRKPQFVAPWAESRHAVG